jgi:hypothetical protein
MLNLIARLLTDPCYRRWRFGSAFVAYFLMVGLGAIPGTRESIGHVASGLVLHSAAYAGITFLLLTGSAAPLWRRVAQSLLTVAALGALDEYIQSFFPYRHGTVTDWYVDVSACLVVLAVYVALPRRKPVALAPNRRDARRAASDS